LIRTEGRTSSERRVLATKKFIRSQNEMRQDVGGSPLDKALSTRKPDPSMVRRPPRTPQG